MLYAGHTRSRIARNSVVIDLPTHDMPRDVRIAKTMFEYLSEPSTIPGEALRISFTMYEEDCDVMREICELAQWNPKNWDYMRSTLSAVASRLVPWRYFTRSEMRHNQEAMEQGEPTKWYVYEMPYKYRARLNPQAWPNYKPDWPPAEELAYMLRRVFDYEVKPALQSAV